MSARVTGLRFARVVSAQFRHSSSVFDRNQWSSVFSMINGSIFSTSLHEKTVYPSARKFSTFQWRSFSSFSSLKRESVESESSQPNISSGTARRRRKFVRRVAFSDSDSESELSELSRDDLVKLLAEKEQRFNVKQEELQKLKDEVARAFTEMENVKERTSLESDHAKKSAIQSFAESLLDVADILGGASSAAKQSFSNVDGSDDISGAVQQLKTLLEGVEMTEKQLLEVFRKFGLQKYDPLDEEFDPNRHHGVIQVPHASKPADHVAVVLKSGYMLHDTVIRLADVGITVSQSN